MEEEGKGKEEGWIFRLPKTFSLSSLLPSFHRRSLSFLSAAINELYQLAAAAAAGRASEVAERDGIPAEISRCKP